MSVTTTVEPFDLQNGGDYPGSRGVVVDASKSGPGIAFSTRFPSVWIADNGDVELDELGGRYSAEDVLAWLDAASAAIRKQLALSEDREQHPLPLLDSNQEPAGSVRLASS